MMVRAKGNVHCRLTVPVTLDVLGSQNFTFDCHKLNDKLEDRLDKIKFALIVRDTQSLTVSQSAPTGLGAGQATKGM